jgi:hypothetical protein
VVDRLLVLTHLDRTVHTADAVYRERTSGSPLV